MLLTWMVSCLNRCCSETATHLSRHDEVIGNRRDSQRASKVRLSLATTKLQVVLHIFISSSHDKGLVEKVVAYADGVEGLEGVI